VLHTEAPFYFRRADRSMSEEQFSQHCADRLDALIVAEGPETVAAFIGEPIQGVGGVIVPPDDYFPLVRAICDKYDVLLIADEVICGFGRTGLWFGQHHWDLRPDIMSFAKGITSGYLQLGGIQISDAIREVIDSAPVEDAWMHGYTYSGHAAACAVGLKNLEIIERENLLENSRVMGERLKAGLSKLLDFPIVGEVRGRGLLCGVEIVKDKETREADPAKALEIYNACLARGLRSRNVGATMAFSPPLTINADEVDQIVDILGSVIDSLS
ncbi:MAG: aspartate aminotransferase family protein, partial [Caldilinea sp.]